MSRHGRSHRLKIELEQEVGRWLLQKGWMLAVAESCTGGLIGHRLTNVPGSSAYYLGSVTAYAYSAKERLLGVRAETLLRYGAVSRETVLEMAEGVRRTFGGDEAGRVVGLSVSGIAGPGGATPEKPVGLVWIGLSIPGKDTQAWQFVGQGDRLQNKAFSAEQALLQLLAGLQA